MKKKCNRHTGLFKLGSLRQMYLYTIQHTKVTGSQYNSVPWYISKGVESYKRRMRTGSEMYKFTREQMHFHMKTTPDRTTWYKFQIMLRWPYYERRINVF